MYCLETHLFTAVRRQVERQHGEKTDSHARNDDVDSVEERFPTHRYVKGYVQVRFITARVELFVSKGRNGIMILK